MSPIINASCVSTHHNHASVEVRSRIGKGGVRPRMLNMCFCLVSAVTGIMASLLVPTHAASQEVVRVENRTPEGSNGTLVMSSTLHLQKDLEIGSDDPVLARVGDIAVGMDGRIYVAEPAQSIVLVYDESGTFIEQIGRPGEGPGDFRSPEALATTARNELLVADRLGVSVFDSTCAFVSRFEHHLADGVIRGMVVSGQFVFLSSLDIWDQTTIHKFARSGTKTATFCESYAAGLDEDYRTEQVFAGGFLDTDPQGRICYSQLTPYEIRKYSDSGQLLMVVDRENTFVDRGEAVRVGNNTMRYSMPSGSYGFCVLGNGRMINSILVGKEQTEKGVPGSFIDVFDSGGHLEGSVVVQPTSQLVGRDSADRLYFVQYSEPIAIVRYQLRG